MKKTTWILWCLLLATILVLSACGGDAADTPVVDDEPVGDAPVVDDSPTGYNGAIYGGTLSLIGIDPTTWDPGHSADMQYTNAVASKLVTYDWWKGPQGSGEWPFANASLWPQTDDIYKGDLAESWELPDDTSVIFHLREGVMWQDKPGIMDAREVVAEDIKWNFDRFLSNPFHNIVVSNTTNPLLEVNALDDYTVEFVYTEWSFDMPVRVLGTLYPMIPPEVLDEFDDMTDWRNVTGSGPFMLTDYISGSAITFESNPNWHHKDPDGNRLPYLDGFKVLIIADTSTQQTALRSGQVDQMNYVSPTIAGELWETNPELLSTKDAPASVQAILLDMRRPPFGPNDDPDALKVRQAASIAIDRQSMIDDYYEGNAIQPTTMMDLAVGIDELLVENLPDNLSWLFDYDPERARELLSEAGYPEGLKVTLTTVADWSEEQYSIIKAYWDAVGIETELKLVDYGTVSAMQWGKTMTGATVLYYGTSFEVGWRQATPDGVETTGNMNGVRNDELTALYEGPDGEPERDPEKRLANFTAINMIIIENQWELMMPTQAYYTFWQPWVQGYSGEKHVNYGGTYEVPAYIWVDESLR